jgi:cobalamin biosynthesis Mg chelatase CobN
VNWASKNARAAASSSGGTTVAASQAGLSVAFLAQPARKARKLGASEAVPQPGSISKPSGTYRALSGAGLGGGQAAQTGHAGHVSGSGLGATGAQAATSRMAASRQMWVIYLEIAVALALAAIIVWWTWPRKPPQ